MSLTRITAAALTAGTVLLLPWAAASPAAAAPTPPPSPAPGSLIDLVPGLLNGLLTGPVATLGPGSSGLQVGVLPSAGPSPVVTIRLPGVLGVTVGGTGAPPPPTSAPGSQGPTPAPTPPPTRATRTPVPSTPTTAAPRRAVVLPTAPNAPSARPSSSSPPAAARPSRRPSASVPLIDSLRQSIPAALALTAGTVLFGVAVLYLMSILGTGRRRDGLPVGALPAGAALADADDEGASLGGVVMTDPDWDYTLDASRGAPV